MTRRKYQVTETQTMRSVYIIEAESRDDALDTYRVAGTQIDWDIEETLTRCNEVAD